MIFAIIHTTSSQSDQEFMLDLYEKYFSFIKKHVFLVVNDAKKTEDLTQSVCVRLIEKVDTLRQLNEYAVPVYIMKTTRAVCTSYLRKHIKRRVNEQALEFEAEGGLELVDYDTNVEAQVVHKLETTRLVQMLDKLPQHHQDILYYRYLLDYSDEEISQTMNISKNSVRQALTRARRLALNIFQQDALITQNKEDKL